MTVALAFVGGTIALLFQSSLMPRIVSRVPAIAGRALVNRAASRLGLAASIPRAPQAVEAHVDDARDLIVYFES
ncbi:hypothetical protein JQ557_25990 [Bradyrhizobium sp. U87765 SZCCT0131]|uniref:hypothetical protein n=1 Tax=unclassified Bradyrhizobium TaxID=2631580 RepID=UPI001BAA7C5E|nr:MULTISPECIES: hypothetical protein [unclassified Bradyrhizobium]MBR1221476.1 hypothetical protein [Bradyrhizobium sp. U87765 SZCCT0131]MBR1264601.1 hypothetical protein [Bradyrhizobium sp. U87765 SZCCT0134]MBR1304493.1 hypothetical protein [Bradyrhizobium sp. U87765 SZCCT0110]MBR1322650.1 hypothetical protein [Bradyrhizobium sp. U87765 SZCCT0109]MBR1346422.1 hypothetical protein [Bradyrhizobium sp. U87765 SZCCT0048]